jgi:hypothetical protein
MARWRQLCEEEDKDLNLEAKKLVRNGAGNIFLDRGACELGDSGRVKLELNGSVGRKVVEHVERGLGRHTPLQLVKDHKLHASQIIGGELTNAGHEIVKEGLVLRGMSEEA